ncbi:hypothetical protein VNI00_018947 [Paramarasmius palmivorus]|uniref:CxC2-like cysteine cluster KDZ transposase-associated domain-containing protein n=1 Tax=Paramarasmius palmivorus TaxID=297713 RepID=A0AAW0AT26_9AGAR
MSKSSKSKKGTFRHATNNPLSSFTSFSSLGLSFHEPQDNVIRTQTASQDQRRIHTQVTLAPPQSPVKPKREYTSMQPSSDWDTWEDIDVPMDDTLPTGDSAIGSSSSKPRKEPTLDPSMKKYLDHRDQFLAISLLLKGRGQVVPETCIFCPPQKDPVSPTFRCMDCTSTALTCQDCCVKRHSFAPLHRILCWNGSHFERVSLRRLGLVIQLGHPDGSKCLLPSKATEQFTVLDTSGLHHVSLSYCGCTSSICPDTQLQRQKWEQLMFYEWFPSTIDRPRTACTFRCLESFQLLTLTAKITAFDYYKTLECLTDNTGRHFRSRYREFLRMVRQWRNLRMLRRAGRGHDAERNVNETQSGELAVKCIACPDPSINLPNKWTESPPELKFLYCLFISIDACFRLKRKRVSSWAKDPSLQDGWAYFVEEQPYREWVLKMKEQKEMSTCSGLSALDHANTKYNIGYDETGKGAGLCARHEFILLNSMGALQVGERYANMDYIVASLLRHVPALLVLLLSYDIMCQWSKKLHEHFLNLPPLVCQILAHRILKLTIPKLHILGHLMKCQERFSLLYTAGAGETDGEGIERLWSILGAIATSIKEMGPGSHHDTLEDHCGDWNWSKVVGLDKLLSKRLLNAVKQFQKQRDSWVSFTAHQRNEAMQWMRNVEDFEKGRTDKNPFSLPECGITIKSVRLQLAEEENAKIKSGLPSIDETTASEFIYFGLEIESRQLNLKNDIAITRTPTDQELTDFVNRRTKLLRQIKRLHTLQHKYSPASLQVFVTLPPESLSPHAEELPLLLPSSLTNSQRASPGCVPGLVKIKRRFREAQLSQTLNDLCQALVVRQRLLRYKKVNARKQGPTTRTRGIINRQLKNINVAEIYRSAWNAMLRLLNNDKSKMQWKQLGKDDVRCMDDPELAEKWKRCAAKNKRAEAQRRENAGLNPLPGAGESSRTISWIWEAANRNSGFSPLQALQDGLQVEYCKAYARVRRWREEVLLLQEEMRRCLKTLSWQEEWWRKRADIPAFVGAHRDSCSAYAHQQATIKRHIAHRFSTHWSKPKISIARGFVPTIPPVPIPSSRSKAPVSAKRKREEDEVGNDEDDEEGEEGEEGEEDEDEDEDEDDEEDGEEEDGEDSKGEKEEGLSDEGDDDEDDDEGYLSIKDRLVVMEEDWDPVGWKMHHVLLFAEYVKACARLEQGYPATPPQYPPELVSACAESADIINPMVEAVGETTVPAPTSLPTTSNPTMMAASLSSSSSSAQPRKRTRRNSDSGDNTPHSPTPELLSDNDQNIPDDSVDYGECGIKLAPGRRMGKYLALELKEMSRQERTKKVLVYSKYTQKDLHKEEQAAKKRFIDDLMNEDSEEEEEEELPTPRGKGKGKAKPKQKARGKGKGKRKHKSMRRDDEDDDEDRDLELDNRGHNAKRQRVERPTVRNEELSHTTPINPGLCTPPSSQYPRIATTPDAEAGARCTATGDGSAQASASALISTSGDADVYATARSIRGATSTACATVRGSGQQADSATSANISVDTQSAPPSPAKASSEPQASAPSSSSALPHEDNSRPGFSGGSSPTLPPPSPSPVKPRSSARSSAPHSLARSSTQPSRSQPPISSASSSSVSSGGRPSWVQQMKDYLASNITGDEWLQCIESWEDMEHEYGFVTTLQSLPTKTRPDAVLFWTKRARKGPTPPDVKQPGFGAAVTDWWNSMMPSWRTRDGHGRWERTGEGNWGALCCPGLNGLLSVLACLRWWLIEECGGLDGSVSHASTEWQAVFNDICWVMEELTKNEGAPVRKKPKSD